MYLFFDTESTGFLKKEFAPDHPQQGRICQLGAIVTDIHENTIAELNVLIKPDGWTIPSDVTAIHGISNEMCQHYGIPIRAALQMFERFVRMSELIVAHNIAFDKGIIANEVLIMGEKDKPFETVVPAARCFCTMEATTDICRLPGKFGRYKWPKLQEAYVHFFGHEFKSAHDAMSDVRACKRIYFELNKVEEKDRL